MSAELMPVTNTLPVASGNLPALPGVVRVSAIPNCLAPNRRWTGTAPALRPLSEIVKIVSDLAGVPPMLRGAGVLWLNGVKIPRWAWGSLYTVDGDSVEFINRPMGGALNSILKVVGAVVGIAIMAWAPFSAPFWGALANGLLAMGATIAFSLLADAIAPIRPPSLNSGNDSRSASPTYSLSASSNDMAFNSPVRVVYGRHLVPPTRIMDDYTQLLGQDEYLYFLGVVGFGPLAIESPALGDTALDLYQDVTLHICYGNPGEPVPNIFPTVVYQTPLSVQLTSKDSQGNELDPESWWVTRSTPDGVDKIGFDIQAPQGSYSLDDNANKQGRQLSVDARYRTSAMGSIPAGPWMAINSVVAAADVGFPGAWKTTRRGEYGDWIYLTEPTRLTSIIYVGPYGDIGVASPTAYGFVLGSSFFKPAVLPERATALCHVVVYGNAIESLTPTSAGIGTGITFIRTGPLTIHTSQGYLPSSFFSYSLDPVWATPDKATRRGFEWRVPRGKYDVQIRRSTAESGSSRVVDALYWTALRSADTTQVPYTGDIPLSMVGLRIKATNQLQNQLPLFTVIATSILPDWDRNANVWIQRPTRNPASAFLDVLRGRGNFRPRPDSEIEFESIQRWHEWCDDAGYMFDGVYDTQSKVYDALADIAAAGRGSPCQIRGKWGVVWQHKQTGQPVAPVTVRNSRSFTSQISYKDLVHGLTIQFINEEKNYEQDTLNVYAPGYNQANATLFESIELFGSPNPDQAAVRGHWYLMEALLLTERYSVTMPLEYLRLQKGQKVRVVRPEVLYGIGSAAITGWTLNGAGAMTDLAWDSELLLTPGVRYGAVVRLVDGSEWTVTGTSDDGRFMVLDEPLPLPVSAQKGENGASIPLIRRGDLVMLGTVGDVGRMCLVTSIRPGDDLTAQVGLVDYIDELYENDGGEVPDYTPSITLPGTGPLRKAKTPQITNIRSDEWALAALPGGGTQPRIWLEWQFTDDSPTAQVQFRRHGDETSAWEYAPAMPPGTTSCYISGVESGYSVANGKPYLNGITYDLRVRAVNSIGWVSEWDTVVEHVVIGKSTPPPAPTRVMLEDTRVWWEMPEYVPLDVVGWRIFMSFDEEDPFTAAKEISGGIWPTRDFDVARWWGWARRVWVVTEDEIGLRSDPVGVLINAGDVVINNVVVSVREAERGWPGEAINGRLADGCLVAESMYPFWGNEGFWS